MGVIKLPLIPQVIASAAEYAIKSADYTQDVGDFKNSFSLVRYKQRLTGQCIQRLYCDLLEKNHVIFETDKTDFKENDEFDIKIHDCIFDVKGSMQEGAPMQIPGYQIDKDVQYYLYGTINFERQYWIPWGFIKKSKAVNNSLYIDFGEDIPHFRRANKMEGGSYFVELDLLNNWEELLKFSPKPKIIRLRDAS